MSAASPSIIAKSPLAKNYGIQEAISAGKDTILTGFDKWNIASLNGHQYISQIHTIKSKARKSNDTYYPHDLENYCEKLNLVKKALSDVIKNVKTFKAQIKSSINILESMNDESLRNHLIEISHFLQKLLSAYEDSFKRKLFVIENIAHTISEEQSHLLGAAWTCDSSKNLIFKLITQLKISPLNCQWNA